MQSRRKPEIQGQRKKKAPALSTSWNVGDVIRDRYEVYDIKRGGIGDVYIVYDHNDKLPYALKKLQDRYALDPLALKRFIREAEVWVRLGQHQNIVRAICVDHIDNQPYILLECIVGSDLRKILRSWQHSPLTKRTVVVYGIQFCRGMIHAQNMMPGFSHLDIKPENCMLTRDNILKVTDFSLSKAVFGVDRDFQGASPNGPSIDSNEKGLAGTLPYMSPEQFIDFGRAGTESDIYSFGVMLYEMLTGKWPLSAKTPLQWRDAHLKARPLEPRAVVPSISEELNELTMRCLAKKHTERPKDFQVIKKRLEDILWKEFHEKIPSSTPEEMESWEYSNRGVSLLNLGHVREAISCFDKALSKNPRNPHPWLNRGVALGKLGNTPEELKCYDKALALNPDYSDAWYNKGMAFHNNGCYEDALPCYDRSLTINPNQAEVWVNKGCAVGSLGRTEEELFCYKKALAIDPNHAKAWVNKASALIILGRLEDANACCDRALAISPTMAEAWTNKASVLGILKRFNESIRCCERALAINAHLCEAWMCKGLALGGLQRFEEELFCYQKALELDPGQPEVWYRRALTLSHLGRLEEALYCCDRTLKINPEASDVWTKKGLVLAAMASFEEAVSCYDKALAIDAKHATAWLNKGLALRNLGLRAEGKRCLRKAIDLDPTLGNRESRSSSESPNS
jgi:tetratricopeptide (TPR) repeat protein